MRSESYHWRSFIGCLEKRLLAICRLESTCWNDGDFIVVLSIMTLCSDSAEIACRAAEKSFHQTIEFRIMNTRIPILHSRCHAGQWEKKKWRCIRPSDSQQHELCQQSDSDTWSSAKSRPFWQFYRIEYHVHFLVSHYNDEPFLILSTITYSSPRRRWVQSCMPNSTYVLPRLRFTDE